MTIPFRDINAAALPYTVALLERWAGKAFKTTQGWKACCPFHHEKTPSFHVYRDGHAHCFGCGERAMDMIHLYAKVYNVEMKEAAKALSRIVGHPFGSTGGEDQGGGRTTHTGADQSA